MSEVMTGLPGRAVGKINKGNAATAIVPQTIDEVFRLAQLMHSSGLCPKQLDSAEKVTVVLLKGLELEMPPMAALESFGVINGKVCIYGDGIPALLWSRGFDIEESFEEISDGFYKATCTVTRPNGKKITKTFDTKDKKRAKLNNALYDTFPQRMYMMRARGWAGRDGASDVLKGTGVYEEQAEIASMKDVTPADDTDLLMPPPMPEEESQDVEEANANQGFFDMIKSSYSQCDSEEEVKQLREELEDDISGLNEADKAQVEAILGGEA